MEEEEYQQWRLAVCCCWWPGGNKLYLFYLHLTKSSQIPLIIIVTSALIVGKDYPHPDGLDYVRRKWKEGLRDPENCKLINKTERISLSDEEVTKENERIIRKAVGRGRYVSI